MFRLVLVLSVVLRIILILYSDWHDAHSVVKYTDVDYRVFSDAARFLIRPDFDEKTIAKGPYGRWLGLGDPYARETYRYTPLLALLLTPNEWLHPSFGKYLFAACDILNGLLIYSLLVSVILPSVAGSGSSNKAGVGKKDGRIDGTTRKLATLYTSLYLLNPLVFTISTRGSSESVLASCVLLTLHCTLRERWDAAAMLLGLSTHWKIYPVIYGVACLAVVGSQDMGRVKDGSIGSWQAYGRTIVNWKTVRFSVLSAATFGMLGAICYLVWGYSFVYESYLYHLGRRDHRHNFSPYFYLAYLTYPSAHAQAAAPVTLPLLSHIARSPLTSFVPQMMLALGCGLLFGLRKQDLVFTWFVQTFVFVLFNKVCTSQYFLWYIVLLPLLLPSLRIRASRGAAYLLVWIGTQALWLAEAYKLEFLGEQVFFSLWVRSCMYLFGNAWVLKGIIDGYGE